MRRIWMILLLLCFSPVSAQSLDVFAGTWAGEIQVPGSALGISVDFQVEGEALIGTITIPTQGVTGAPLEDVTADGDGISFAIQGVPGEPTFEGTLQEGRIEGAFSQGGQAFPFTLAQGEAVTGGGTGGEATGGAAVTGTAAPAAAGTYEDPRLGAVRHPRRGGRRRAKRRGGLRSGLWRERGWRNGARHPRHADDDWLDGQNDDDDAHGDFGGRRAYELGRARDKRLCRSSPWPTQGLPRPSPCATWSAPVRGCHGAISSSFSTPTVSRRRASSNRSARSSSFTDFGEAFQYSNQMVGTGGYAAAAADGAAFGELFDGYASSLQERVLGPIGMANTTLSFDEVEARGNHGAPHQGGVDGTYAPIPLSDERLLVPIAPAGSHWSTANDMARYLETELGVGVAPTGERVVSEENLRTTWEAQAPVSATTSYGLGWFVDEYKGLRAAPPRRQHLGLHRGLGFFARRGFGRRRVDQRAGHKPRERGYPHAAVRACVWARAGGRRGP